MKSRLVVCRPFVEDILEPLFLVAVIPESPEMKEVIESIVLCNKPLADTYGSERNPVVITVPVGMIKAFALNMKCVGSDNFNTINLVQDISESLGGKSFVVEAPPLFDSNEVECFRVTVYIRVSVAVVNNAKVEILVRRLDQAGDEREYCGEIPLCALLNEPTIDVDSFFSPARPLS